MCNITGKLNNFIKKIQQKQEFIASRRIDDIKYQSSQGGYYIYFKMKGDGSKKKIERELNKEEIFMVDEEGVKKVLKNPQGEKVFEVLLSWENTKELVGKIEILYCRNYRDIKTDNLWLDIYMRNWTDIAYINSNGGPDTQQESVIPCHNCGIRLPLDYIQVDHYMPQSGDVFYPILKTMRALGMTQEGPKNNAKSYNIEGILGNNNIDKFRLHPKGNKRGKFLNLSKELNKEKWATSEKGEGFLTILHLIDQNFSTLGLCCLNSFLNLVPLCSVCNNAKGAKIKNDNKRNRNESDGENQGKPPQKKRKSL